MTYGESLSLAVKDYLTANRLKSLGAINGEVLADIAQRHYDHWQAQNKPVKAPKPRKEPSAPQSDAEWLQTLSESPANKGLDVKAEFDKAQFWVREQPGRRFTRRFFVNWLLKADRPLGGLAYTKDTQATEQRPHVSHNLSDTPRYDWRSIATQLFPPAEFPQLALASAGWHDTPVSVRQAVIKQACQRH